MNAWLLRFGMTPETALTAIWWTAIGIYMAITNYRMNELKRNIHDLEMDLMTQPFFQRDPQTGNIVETHFKRTTRPR